MSRHIWSFKWKIKSMILLTNKSPCRKLKTLILVLVQMHIYHMPTIFQGLLMILGYKMVLMNKSFFSQRPCSVKGEKELSINNSHWTRVNVKIKVWRVLWAPTARTCSPTWWRSQRLLQGGETWAEGQIRSSEDRMVRERESEPGETRGRRTSREVEGAPDTGEWRAGREGGRRQVCT